MTFLFTRLINDDLGGGGKRSSVLILQARENWRLRGTIEEGRVGKRGRMSRLVVWCSGGGAKIRQRNCRFAGGPLSEKNSWIVETRAGAKNPIEINGSIIIPRESRALLIAAWAGGRTQDMDVLVGRFFRFEQLGGYCLS